MRIIWLCLFSGLTGLGFSLLNNAVAIATPLPTSAVEPVVSETSVEALSNLPSNPPNSPEYQTETLPNPSVDDVSTEQHPTLTSSSAAQIETATEPMQEGDELAQVTAVSQLADVQETDWAFEALRSLVEKYGVIAGYPDGTFRGRRTVTRYEFAAGLNAALNRIEELIAQDENQVSREDLITLQQLQEEFSSELAALGDRLDNIEARIAQLEANQFSTTTILRGETIFAFNGGTQSGEDDPHSVFLSRVRLNLETSFTGTDALIAQIQTGTGQSNDDAADFLLRDEGAFRDDLVDTGNEITEQTLQQLAGLDLDDVPQLRLSNQDSIAVLRDTLAGNLQALARLSGRSPTQAREIFNIVSDAVEVAQGVNGFLQTNSALDYSGADNRPRLNRLSYTFVPFKNVSFSLFAQGFASDYVDFNRFANNSAQDFSTYGLINNQLLLGNDPAGAGAALSWNPGGGFFTLRAVYRAEAAAIASRPDNEGNQGGLFGDPYLGVVELGFTPFDALSVKFQYSGGAQGDDEYDVVGLNLELALNKNLGLFGRFGYAFNFPGGIQPTSWSAGVTLTDLLIPGAVAGIGISQPLVFQEDVISFFNSTQTNYEVFYKLPLNDNIAITPLFQVITDPGNRGGSAIFTGTLRTVFTF